MRAARTLFVIVLAIVTFGLIYRAVEASFHTHLPVRLSPLDGPAPQFTRLVTVTIEPGSPLTPALTSDWLTSILSFPVGASGYNTTIVLPSDSTGITVDVTGGTYAIVGTSVVLTLTDSICNFAWAYRTNQSVLRQGNQYRIDQSASANNYFLYSSTITFPALYQYVGITGTAPIAHTGNTIQWQQVVPLNANPIHRFSASTWLVDSRVVDKPDLHFTAASFTMKPSTTISVAHVSAVVHNDSPTMDSGAPAYIQLYDRPAPSPPTGPLDSAGGWCSDVVSPVCPTSNTFTNPVELIPANKTLTLTTDYTFTQHGWRYLYLQIDTFGGDFGLNIESNDANNIRSLGQVYIPPPPIYLPVVRK